MKINRTNRAQTLPHATFPATQCEPQPAPRESPGA